VASSIRNSSEVAEATAERREALAADIETLPEFLDEFEPTMEDLGSLADESTPVLNDLGARADDINDLVRRLGPFSQAAIPAIDSLGEAAKTGTPAVTDARPVIADLGALAKSIRPVGTNLREVLESFRDTDGIQRLMDYIFFQTTAVNGYDAVGHYLRAGLLVNQCTTYAIRPVAGCTANYPQTTAAASSLKATTSAVDAIGEDPVLRATAIAIARALGQQVEQEKAKLDDGLTGAKGRIAPAGAAPKSRSKAAPSATPTAPPATAPPTGSTVAPATAPTTAPTQAPAVETPAPTAAAPVPTPAPPTPTPDPSEGLLDFLFGKDGG
jgi:hypothetical protein